MDKLNLDKDTAAALLEEAESRGCPGTDTGYSQLISLQVPIGLLERIDKTPGVTRSSLIRRAIWLYFLVLDAAKDSDTHQTHRRSNP
jgi:hypothetical protein